ncbi:MAG: Maf family nucleotide pyrophosphatase [Ectothiorhodospiraceae bacterium]|nr:septum formation inhibitor Maf [Paracoccaceae bacterium]MCH8503724.1 Maf family nucleotide pyrophosphatase [Ectothiorhodospiraceae bacterium]
MRTPRLILASSSRYRRALLDRLHLDYLAVSPDIDESRLPNEPPAEYVRRLAEEKARAVARHHQDALIIGSDQAAVLEDRVLGKPGTLERATEQLRQASGRRVEFLTGLSLYDAAADRALSAVVPFAVHFRELGDAEIKRYLEKEPALDAAGSFHSEGYGISLFRSLEGDDPTALVGLPLIKLCELLRQCGVALP